LCGGIHTRGKAEERGRARKCSDTARVRKPEPMRRAVRWMGVDIKWWSLGLCGEHVTDRMQAEELLKRGTVGSRGYKLDVEGEREGRREEKGVLGGRAGRAGRDYAIYFEFLSLYCYDRRCYSRLV
jgi:hypothetical protein